MCLNFWTSARAASRDAVSSDGVVDGNEAPIASPVMAMGLVMNETVRVCVTERPGRT
jgi:hypothetical protein